MFSTAKIMTTMPSQAGCVGSSLLSRARAEKSAVAHKSPRVVCTTTVPGEDAKQRGARLVPRTAAERMSTVSGVESDDENKNAVVKRFDMKQGTLYVSHVWKAQ